MSQCNACFDPCPHCGRENEERALKEKLRVMVAGFIALDDWSSEEMLRVSADMTAVELHRYKKAEEVVALLRKEFKL